MPDIHSWSGVPTTSEKEAMQERIRLFIFPNVVSTEEEQIAFDKAVNYQIVHDKSREERFAEIPDGANSFKIADFSMDFEEGVNGSGLTYKTICQSAYSVLLRAGLLYRGVEGRCC